MRAEWPFFSLLPSNALIRLEVVVMEPHEVISFVSSPAFFFLAFSDDFCSSNLTAVWAEFLEGCVARILVSNFDSIPHRISRVSARILSFPQIAFSEGVWIFR